MKKKARNAAGESMADAPDDEGNVHGAPELSLEDANSDFCQKLLDRYANSSAPQHIHLCASAAAMRAILQEEGLPLIPLAYFAATISAIDDAMASKALDSDAVAALTSFLSMLIPLVPSESMPPSKAIDAVGVLVRLLEKVLDAEATATVRCVVKSLGALLVLCDLEDWEAIKSPFEMIVGLCFDKRPKVRRCAQMCVEKVFKSFNLSFVIKEASKVVLSLFNRHLPLALEFSAEKTGDASKNESDLKQENFKVLHTLNLVKLSVPFLSKKASSKILSDILKLLTCKFAPVVSHSLTILEAFFESSTAEIIIPEAEKIIASLVSLISSGLKYPTDTIVSASVLAKRVLGELHSKNLSSWIGNLPLVFGSIAGMLVLDANISTQAAGILKDLINNHMDMRFFHDCQTQLDAGRAMGTAESRSIESICVALENLLCSNGVPNGATLAVISDLFLKLGKISDIYMKGVLVKLANVMISNGDGVDIIHLHDCIGSAVTAMGPEKSLTMIPISFQEESLTCSNIWLVPILKKYVVGSSLGYFIENIMPLVESLQQAFRKVKKASLRQNLHTHLHELWDLLPAFCRYPTDTQKNFEPVAKIFEDLLKKDSFMHENIALALQELVNQNKIIVQSTCNESESRTLSVTCNAEQLKTEATSVPHHYSTKVATRNVKVISSCSNGLLQALTDVFFDSPPAKRIILKEAIGCLASIIKTSKVKRIFTSTLEKYRLTNGVDASEKLESVGFKSVDSKHRGIANKVEGEAYQSIIFEFASSLVEGANEDLINMIFDCIRPALEDTIGVGQAEAYYTLSRIFKEHTWFISSRFDEMMNLLVGIKSPTDSLYLRSRFACIHDLLVHILQSDFEEKSSKAFLILNEVILALKNSNEEARKVAYDILMRISCSLKNASSIDSDSPRQKLYNMIMGYLSGAPPQIMTGAVSALSLLIYKDNAILFSIPELVPSVLVLLQSKAKEIIKAVLGFVKVLVSCLQANDLQKILPDIVNGILPWSSVSRNHFRSKVTVIFEIIIRKCGAASVLALAPEKYEGFINSVLEQRHGRISLKDVDGADMPVKPPASPINRRHKRKHEEISHPGEGTGSETTLNRIPQVKIGKKREFNAISANELRHNGGIHRESQRKRRSKRPQAAMMTAKYEDGGGKQAGRGPNKRFKAGREEAIGWRKETKRSKLTSHISASSSKFHKHSKIAARPQRTKK